MTCCIWGSVASRAPPLREFTAGACNILFKDRGGPQKSEKVVTYKSVASKKLKESGLNIMWDIVLDVLTQTGYLDSSVARMFESL
jgi:hypothetical protein